MWGGGGGGGGGGTPQGMHTSRDNLPARICLSRLQAQNVCFSYRKTNISETVELAGGGGGAPPPPPPGGDLAGRGFPVQAPGLQFTLALYENKMYGNVGTVEVRWSDQRRVALL